MNKKIRNILLVGSGVSSSALAKTILNSNPDCKIFINCAENATSEYFEYIDIRDDNLTELLKFVLENNIDLTIPLSQKALSSDIVSFFQSNGQDIFGPCKNICSIFFNKIKCKKLLYKLRTQNTKFSIFSKPSLAYEYLNDANYPLFISTDLLSKTQDSLMVCPSIRTAQNFLDKLFLNGTQDIIVQEFPYGINFTAYFITDGYSAVPLTTVRNFKFTNPDKSGAFTDGVGCYVPEYKVGNIVNERLQNIAQNILKYFDSINEPYIGILGIECVLTDDNRFYVLDLKPSLQEHDSRAVLNICDDNLLKIIYSCINGYFSDEYDQINTKNYSSISVSVYTEKENVQLSNISNNYDIDFVNVIQKDSEIYTKSGINFIITKTAPTLTRAKIKLIDDMKDIKFFGMKYRKDICDKITV